VELVNLNVKPWPRLKDSLSYKEVIFLMEARNAQNRKWEKISFSGYIFKFHNNCHYSLHSAGYFYLKSWLSLSLSKNVLLSYGTPRFITATEHYPVWPIDPSLPKVQFNVILPPTPRSSQWSLPAPMRATCPAHLILLDLITLTISVKNTGYEVHHYAIFSMIRLPPF
jgi:hypothetical protein